MLDFVCVILPGIFFTFVTEKLLRQKLSFHDFAFLAVTNEILLNLLTLGVRHFIVDFMYLDTAEMGLGDSFAAASAIKYLMVSAVVGLILSLLEVFACKYLSLGLEITEQKKEDAE